MANKHVEELNALYVEAINNGFDVTSDEVNDYIKELKNILKNAENQEEIKSVMNAFDSEDEYWDYEYTVYQKQLPVQKYVKSLEENFVKKESSKLSSEEAAGRRDDEFEKIKDNLVKKQNFKKVNSNKDINSKFEN